MELKLVQLLQIKIKEPPTAPKEPDYSSVFKIKPAKEKSVSEEGSSPVQKGLIREASEQIKIEPFEISERKSESDGKQKQCSE